MALFRKKKIFREYNIDIEYEFNTYKHVGWDYGDSKTAHLGWVFNWRRWKRKRKNRKETKYKFCDKYTAWKQHVRDILPVHIQNYDDLLHYLYLQQYRAEHYLETIKCVLIPLYIAVIGVFGTVADYGKLGDDLRILFYAICMAIISYISTSVLVEKMKRVDFYRDFIEIAEEVNRVASYNRYDFESTEEVEKYLGIDLKRMLFCIKEYGCVSQNQIEGLSGDLCESCSDLIVKALSEAIDKSVFYAYSKKSNSYVFYDTERISYAEARNQTDKVQSFLYGE